MALQSLPMTKADDDDFDPSRVLDGWRARQDPPKPDHGPAIDLTRVLDGWQRWRPASCTMGVWFSSVTV